MAESVFASAWRGVRHLLAEEAASAVPGAAASPEPAAPVCSPERFERALRQMMHDGDGAISGRVHFLRLQEALEALPATGGSGLARAAELIESVTRRSLAPGDFFMRHAEDAWVVIFRTLSAEEATLKCALIAREISERLFGDTPARSAVEVRTTIVRADGRLKTKPISLADALLDAHRYAKVHLVRPPPLDERMLGAEPRPSSPSTRSGKDGGGQAPAAVRRVRQKPSQPVEYVATAPDELPPELEGFEQRLTYRPIWQISRRLIALHGVDQTYGRNGSPAPIEAFEGALSPARRAALDLRLVRAAFAAFASEEAAKPDYLLAIPVRAQTLLRETSRLAFLDLCEAAPSALRSALVFEIVWPSAGMAEMKALPAIAALKPYGRAVMLRSSGSFTNFGALVGSGLLGVGFNWGDENASESELTPRLDRFARLAGAAGFRAYLSGVQRLSVAAAAICAGFEFLSGDAIALAAEEPGSARRFEALDMYHGNLEERAQLSTE